MPHSYVSALYHIVFSTKGRRKSITPTIADRLWPYIGGIARENGMRALAVGGVEDHAHLLLALPATMALAKAVQLLKGTSSRWLRETFAEGHDFA